MDINTFVAGVSFGLSIVCFCQGRVSLGLFNIFSVVINIIAAIK